jgi:hypothetical protein
MRSDQPLRHIHGNNLVVWRFSPDLFTSRFWVI